MATFYNEFKVKELQQYKDYIFFCDTPSFFDSLNINKIYQRVYPIWKNTSLVLSEPYKFIQNKKRVWTNYNNRKHTYAINYEIDDLTGYFKFKFTEQYEEHLDNKNLHKNSHSMFGTLYFLGNSRIHHCLPKHDIHDLIYILDEVLNFLKNHSIFEKKRNMLEEYLLVLSKKYKEIKEQDNKLPNGIPTLNSLNLKSLDKKISMLERSLRNKRYLWVQYPSGFNEDVLEKYLKENGCEYKHS